MKFWNDMPDKDPQGKDIVMIGDTATSLPARTTFQKIVDFLKGFFVSKSGDVLTGTLEFDGDHGIKHTGLGYTYLKQGSKVYVGNPAIGTVIASNEPIKRKGSNDEEYALLDENNFDPSILKVKEALEVKNNVNPNLPLMFWWADAGKTMPKYFLGGSSANNVWCYSPSNMLVGNSTRFNGNKEWNGTQQEFDSITIKEEDTYYFILED